MVYLYLVIGLLLLYWKHRTGVEALPEHLKYKIHNDYDFVLELIPRSLTAYKTKPPKLLWGYNVYYYGIHDGVEFPHPIQPRLNGRWISIQICWLPFISISTKWGWYFICGFRYDGVDFYTNFPTLDISKIGGFQK